MQSNLMEYWQLFINFTKEPYFNSLLNLTSVILLLATAWINYRSWKTASRANELQLLPLLSIYFRGKAMSDRKICIRNIGKSPAYDIKIEHFVLVLYDIQRIWRLEMEMVGTNVLVPDEERGLLLKGTVYGQTADIKEFLIHHLDPEEEHERKRINLILNFRNAEGKHYFLEFETGIGGLNVKPARKINILSRIYLLVKKIDEVLFIARNKIIWKFRKPYIVQPKNRGK